MPTLRTKSIGLGTTALLACAVLTACSATGDMALRAPDTTPVPQLFANVSGRTAAARQVAESVHQALLATPKLSRTPIQVEGFDGGIVILRGVSSTTETQVLATNTAHEVPGVSDVLNRMQTE